MQKRGISTIISVVLIIGLVMVVSSIVWITVSKVVNRANTEISVGKVNLDMKILSVKVDSGKLAVSVQREKGIGDLTGIKFIVEGKGETEIVNQDTSMKEFDISNFDLTLEKVSVLDVEKVSIAPVLSAGVGDIKSVWEKGKKGVSCTSSETCETKGYNCGIFTDDCGNEIPCGGGLETKSCTKDFGTTCLGITGTQNCVNNKFGDCIATDPREATCSGKECGSDGCGGFCTPYGNSCPSGESCISGQCVCVPNCEGKQCGDDGCGGSCGTCSGANPVCNEATKMCVTCLDGATQPCTKLFGTCTATGTQTCSGNAWGSCVATNPAATCTSLGKTCGSWSNNCGGTLNCGICSVDGYYCNAVGTCEKRLIIFLTTFGSLGNLKGTSVDGPTGADTICSNTWKSFYPTSSRIFKALIGASNRKVGTNWVLKKDTSYYKSDGATLIKKTNANAWFDFNLASYIGSGYVWTGLNADGTANTAKNCVDWTSTSSSLSSYLGIANSVSSSFVFSSTQGYCNKAYNLYCVEQS